MEGEYVFKYPEASFIVDERSQSILVVCPKCKKVMCIEDSVFGSDEIGECEYCKRMVYIPWESFYEKIN
jgi:hypothetical protein